MQVPTVVFIGLGNIGFSMAGCLVRAGLELIGFDLDEQKVARIVAAGATAAPSASAAAQADVVVSRVPGRRDARRLYLEDGVVCAIFGMSDTEAIQRSKSLASSDHADDRGTSG